MVRKVYKCGRKGLAVVIDHETLEEPPHVSLGLTLAGEPVMQLGYVLGADEQE